MRTYCWLCLCIALLTVSCGPSSRILSSAGYAPLPEDTPVTVLTVSQQPSSEWTSVGKLKIGDSGLSTNCNYPAVVARAQAKAREIGGNLIKITQHKKPDMASTCHRIWADAYLVPAGELFDYEQVIKESFAVDKELLAEGCAMIYFYRSRNFAGSAVGYNVQIDDEVVWRASNNRKEWIKVMAVGLVRISAKTEAERELILDLRPGRSYYIRCGIDMGVMVGRPSLELVDESIGKYEFEDIEENNTRR